MAFTALYDACVLHPAPLRDLLVRIGMTGVVQVRWSDQILDECFESVLRRRPDLSRSALSRTRQLMIHAVPDCLVSGYESLVDGLCLPDPDDRHVLAAAIRGGAETIVTSNLKDFPADRLSEYGIEARDPDDFIMGLIDLTPGAICTIVEQQLTDLTNPPVTRAELFKLFRDQGLVRTVAELTALMP